MGKRTAMQGPILVLLDILLNPMAFSHYALFVRLEFQSLFWWNIILNKSQ